MRRNKIIILLEIIYSFFISLFESIIMFLKHLFLRKKDHLLKENKFIDIINFVFNT